VQPAAEPTVYSTPTLPKRPSDWDDPNLGWSVQSSAAFKVQSSVPGQVFVIGQLPNPQVQADAGFHPESHNSGLIVVSAEEAATHPGGPEPADKVALAANATDVTAGTTNAAATTAILGDPAAPALVSTVPQVPPAA
jgi:hypothetical protein